MAKIQKKQTWGGGRPGAGRKDPVTKRRVNFTIDEAIARQLDQEANKSRLVEKLLVEHYANPLRNAP